MQCGVANSRGEIDALAALHRYAAHLMSIQNTGAVTHPFSASASPNACLAVGAIERPLGAVRSVLSPTSINPAQTGEAVACVKLIPSLQFIFAQAVRHLCLVECDRLATKAVAKPELCKRCPTFYRRQQFSAGDGSIHTPLKRGLPMLANQPTDWALSSSGPLLLIAGIVKTDVCAKAARESSGSLDRNPLPQRLNGRNMPAGG
jgi:hypothetical protein